MSDLPPPPSLHPYPHIPAHPTRHRADPTSLLSPLTLSRVPAFRRAVCSHSNLTTCKSYRWSGS